MRSPRTVTWLLRLYPRSWRERFGEELVDVIQQISDQQRLPWSTWLDLILGAARERVRSVQELGPRDGALLTLCAWALFVIAGSGLQKASEHWQAALPADRRPVASAAFDTLVAAAALGSALVLAGIALALPRVASFLRSGGWPGVRRRVLAAGTLTGVAAALTALLVLWAHGLSGPARNGQNDAYAAAFLIWIAISIAAFASWTVVAVTIARRLTLSPATLRLETRLATAVAAAMLVITCATAVWACVQLAVVPLAGAVVLAWILMLVATVLGALGARRASDL